MATTSKVGNCIHQSELNIKTNRSKLIITESHKELSAAIIRHLREVKTECIISKTFVAVITPISFENPP